MAETATTSAAETATTGAATGSETLPAGTGSSQESTPPSADWRSGLPETIRGEKTLEKFVSGDGLDLGKIAESYVNLEKAHSKKTEGLVKVPGPEATAEEKAAWNTALGIPASPEQYEITLPEALAPIVPPAAIDGWKPVFHQLGVPTATAQAIVQAFAEKQQEQVAALERTRQEGLAKIKAQVGEAAFNRQTALVSRLVENVAAQLGQETADSFAKFTTASGLLDSDFAHYRVLGWIAEQFAEQGHIDTTTVGGMAPASAAARIKEIQGNKEYLNGSHPQQRELQAEVDRLAPVAYSTQRS